MAEATQVYLRTCQGLTANYRFWVAVGAAALLEPILCANYDKYGMLAAQSVVLFTSVALFVVQIGGDLAANPTIFGSFSSAYFHFHRQGEYVLEFICLVTGVVFLFPYPGIAALRCFRVFRLLWLSDNANFRQRVTEKLSPIMGEPFVDRVFRVFRFAIHALSALGNEMFRLTSRTRGGLLLMLVLFYMAFVFGMALWIETGSPDNACGRLGGCMYTMLRLTFFDGSGLDYAYSLVGHHKFLFALVMCYLCISSFGIINGLIGIFGTVFATAAETAFVRGWSGEGEGEEGESESEGEQPKARTKGGGVQAPVIPEQVPVDDPEAASSPKSRALSDAELLSLRLPQDTNARPPSARLFSHLQHKPAAASSRHLVDRAAAEALLSLHDQVAALSKDVAALTSMHLESQAQIAALLVALAAKDGGRDPQPTITGVEAGEVGRGLVCGEALR